FGPGELQLKLRQLFSLDVELLFLFLVERHEFPEFPNKVPTQTDISYHKHRIAAWHTKGIAKDTNLPDHSLKILSDTITEGNCLLLVLSRKRPGAKEPVAKVSVRPVEVQRQTMYQF